MYTKEYVIRHVWSRGPGQTSLSPSLFGGLCSQTASPLLLCICSLVSSMAKAKGEGYKCRVGVSRNFSACAYVKCAPDGRYEHIRASLTTRLARSRSLIIVGERERANLVVQLARFFCLYVYIYIYIYVFHRRYTYRMRMSSIYT